MEDGHEVRGIALVVEEAGQGAKLVFRYPGTDAFQCQNPFDTSPIGIKSGGFGETSGIKQHTKRSRSNPNFDRNTKKVPNLFFSLPQRTMEKLFRPKPPLCDRPMTLSVGKTMFCYRAASLSSQSKETESKLVLFSVIVAFSPTNAQISKQATTQITKIKNKEQNMNNNEKKTENNLYEDHQTKKIHNLLHRLCKVLQREEYRCQYVSKQSTMLLSIMEEERQSILSVMALSGMTVNTVNVTNGSTGISLSADSSTHGNLSLSHSRNPSINESLNLSFHKNVNISFNNPSSTNSSTYNHDNTQQKHEITIEHEQNILERMLASVNHSSPYSKGNLARELAQVYHILALSDDSIIYSSLPSSVASSKSNHPIVYINAHIALPIPTMREFVSSNPNSSSYPYLVRPYHTLLFSNTQDQLQLPQILQNIPDNFNHNYNYNHCTFPSPKRSKLLLMSLSIAHPQKSIAELSRMAGIPLTQSLELASSLLLHHRETNPSNLSHSQLSSSQQNTICIRTHGLHSSTTFICQANVQQRISFLSLPFAQKFGTNQKFLFRNTVPLPPLFVVVSAFVSTSSMTLSLGQILTILMSSSSFDIANFDRSMSSEDSLPHSSSSSTTSSMEDDLYFENMDISPQDKNQAKTSKKNRTSKAFLEIPVELKPLKHYVDRVMDMEANNGNEIGIDVNSVENFDVSNDSCIKSDKNGLGSTMGIGVGSRSAGIISSDITHENKFMSLNSSNAAPFITSKSPAKLSSQPLMASLTPSTLFKQQMEQYLFSMVVWLRVHKILVERRDYIISTAPCASIAHLFSEKAEQYYAVDRLKDSKPNICKDENKSRSIKKQTQKVLQKNIDTASNTFSSNTIVDTPNKVAITLDEPEKKDEENLEEKEMYRILQEENCLAGTISTVAMCWKYSWEKQKLLKFVAWGTKNNVIRIISRSPELHDDWGLP